MIDRRAFLFGTGAVLLAVPLASEAQQAGKVYRVGVVLEGGPYYAAIDGLRAGLKEAGFEEGKQYLLSIRDVKGDLKTIPDAARDLEQERVDLIYAVGTGTAIAVRRATTTVPVVFYACCSCGSGRFATGSRWSDISMSASAGFRRMSAR